MKRKLKTAWSSSHLKTICNVNVELLHQVKPMFNAVLYTLHTDNSAVIYTSVGQAQAIIPYNEIPISIWSEPNQVNCT